MSGWKAWPTFFEPAPEGGFHSWAVRKAAWPGSLLRGEAGPVPDWRRQTRVFPFGDGNLTAANWNSVSWRRKGNKKRLFGREISRRARRKQSPVAAARAFIPAHARPAQRRDPGPTGRPPPSARPAARHA